MLLSVNYSCGLFAEINKENCIDGVEILSMCSFQIRINPPLAKSLECKLKFNNPSNEMIFSNIKFRVKAQEDNKCPLLKLGVIVGNKSEIVKYLKDL